MTLEEAIKYAENMVFLSHRGSGNTEREHNHRQLAEWLKDYKRLLKEGEWIHHGKYWEECSECHCDMDRVYRYCPNCGSLMAENVGDLPSVKPQKTEWIPCLERLPEAEYGESDSVLVCFENEKQDVLYFDGGNWRYPTGETYISVNHKNDWHNKVIAWLPLPEPYKAESEV